MRIAITATECVQIRIDDPAMKRPGANHGDCLIHRFLLWQSRTEHYPIYRGGGTSCSWFYCFYFAPDDAREAMKFLRAERRRMKVAPAAGERGEGDR